MKSKVITITDKYGIKQYYKNNVILVEKENFSTASLNESASYDIIHLHSVDALVYKLRRRYGNKKKIILHYHGTDLRGSYKKSISLALRLKRVGIKMKKRLWLIRNWYTGSIQETMQRLADIVLFSTPDLLKLAISLIIYQILWIQNYSMKIKVASIKMTNMMQLLLKLKPSIFRRL